MKRKKCESIICLFLIACGTACSRYEQVYGVAYNPARHERGIPPVPPGAESVSLGSTIDYTTRNPDTKKPWRTKRVFLGKNGRILSESDTFYSGKTFKWGHEQETLFEKVYIEYTYAREESGNPWQITLTGPPDKFMDKLSLAEADRILGSWGLSRTGIVTAPKFKGPL